MKKNLVLLDTDHIKRYVFATDKLKEIRGASALFDELNRITMPAEHIRLYKEVAPDMTEEEVKNEQIYTNGGAGMVWLPEEYVREFIDTIRQVYRQKTINGSITGIAEPKLPDQNEQALLQKIFLEAQIAKADSSGVKTLITHPLFKDCESCGEEYAVEKDRDEEELLCQSCLNKRERDKKIKKEIQEGILELLHQPEQDKPYSEKLWDRILFGLKDRLGEFKDTSLDRPGDLNQLGEMSTPSNYIALIYADGNNMGTIIDNLETVEQLKKFSNAVDNAMYQAVIQAINGPLWPETGQGVFPFDILLLGGDDLVMVTTAQKAIETAITITKTFYEETEKVRDFAQQAGEHGPTLSVSVVFVHAKFPFATSLSLAESALKFTKKELAKRKIENENFTPEGMINFMVVHNSNTLDFKAMYDQELFDHEQQIYRTLRPYPIDKMEQLRNTVKHTLQKVPKTKLHQIREAIFLPGKERATLSTFAALLRAKEYEKQEILNIVKEFAGELGKEYLDYPWYGIKNEETQEIYYYTPLLDAIELYDFIE